MKAVILAAGLGTRLEPLTHKIPKRLVEVDGVPMVDRMIARVGEAGIREVIVVTGHLREVLERHLAESENELARNATVVFNERYSDWGNFYSLLVAREAIGDSDFIKFDGDVVLDPKILPALMSAPGPAVLAVDCRGDLGAEEMKARKGDDGRIVELNKRMEPGTALGESIGVDRIDASLAETVFAELEALIDNGETDEYYERAYERLMERGIHFEYADITDCLWCEVDDAADLEHAHKIIELQTSR